MQNIQVVVVLRECEWIGEATWVAEVTLVAPVTLLVAQMSCLEQDSPSFQTLEAAPELGRRLADEQGRSV